MFQNLEIFQMAYSMARHAGQRQALTARNMANADTPGYRAMDVAPFKDTLRSNDAAVAQKATRAAHLNGAMSTSSAIAEADIIEDPVARVDPNGNSVSVESEMLRSVEAKRDHDRALAIYRSSMTILRTSIDGR